MDWILSNIKWILSGIGTELLLKLPNIYNFLIFLLSCFKKTLPKTGNKNEKDEILEEESLSQAEATEKRTKRDKMAKKEDTVLRTENTNNHPTHKENGGYLIVLWRETLNTILKYKFCMGLFAFLTILLIVIITVFLFRKTTIKEVWMLNSGSCSAYTDPKDAEINKKVSDPCKKIGLIVKNYNGWVAFLDSLTKSASGTSIKGTEKGINLVFCNTESKSELLSTYEYTGEASLDLLDEEYKSTRRLDNIKRSELKLHQGAEVGLCKKKWDEFAKKHEKARNAICKFTNKNNMLYVRECEYIVEGKKLKTSEPYSREYYKISTYP